MDQIEIIHEWFHNIPVVFLTSLWNSYFLLIGHFITLCYCWFWLPLGLQNCLIFIALTQQQLDPSWHNLVWDDATWCIILLEVAIRRCVQCYDVSTMLKVGPKTSPSHQRYTISSVKRWYSSCVACNKWLFEFLLHSWHLEQVGPFISDIWNTQTTRLAQLNHPVAKVTPPFFPPWSCCHEVIWLLCLYLKQCVVSLKINLCFTCMSF